MDEFCGTWLHELKLPDQKRLAYVGSPASHQGCMTCASPACNYIGYGLGSSSAGVLNMKVMVGHKSLEID